LPPIVVVFSILLDDCAADEAALGVELLTAVPPPEPEGELPHAATIKAAAANPAGAHHLPRIASLRSLVDGSDTPDHVATIPFVHRSGENACGQDEPSGEAGPHD
jgi:hypothetical protein